MQLLDRTLVVATYIPCAALTARAAAQLHRWPATVRAGAGVVIFLGGIALWVWGRATFRNGYAQVARAPTLLVTDGPFRIVRHPLYTSTAIACIGQALAS
ncbi:MAG: methyltransferase family protein, partial [Candidatus Krumholzibacteriia bacterium]